MPDNEQRTFKVLAYDWYEEPDGTCTFIGGLLQDTTTGNGYAFQFTHPVNGRLVPEGNESVVASTLATRLHDERYGRR